MLRKKLIVLSVLAATAAVGSAATAAGGGDGDRETFTLRDVAVQQEFVDLGPAGPSLGDLVVFNDVLKRPGDDRRVGRLYGSCTLTRADPTRQAFHCEATTALRDGTIEQAGTVFLVPAQPDRRNVVAITGGTGRFRGAAGQIILRDAGQPIEIFTYQLDR
jgi:hypothetical protein